MLRTSSIGFDETQSLSACPYEFAGCQDARIKVHSSNYLGIERTDFTDMYYEIKFLLMKDWEDLQATRKHFH